MSAYGIYDIGCCIGKELGYENEGEFLYISPPPINLTLLTYSLYIFFLIFIVWIENDLG